MQGGGEEGRRLRISLQGSCIVLGVCTRWEIVTTMIATVPTMHGIANCCRCDMALLPGMIAAGAQSAADEVKKVSMQLCVRALYWPRPTHLVIQVVVQVVAQQQVQQCLLANSIVPQHSCAVCRHQHAAHTGQR